jgi:glycosyltransferase involved in cell wall biosynthesis
MMKLSVIIPTRNRARTLERTLASLTQQRITNNSFEVIVVDNGSTDATAEVCGKLGAQFRHFTRLYDEHPGLHVGRHLGMQHARSDILVYADDDIEATPEWLESILLAFQRPDATLVGGKNLPLFEAPPPAWIEALWAPKASGERVCGWLSLLDLGDVPHEISPYHVYGCNFSIRKSVLLQTDGFHPDGMPKDLIRFRGDGETHVSRYIKQQGLAAFYHPGASVGHFVSRDRLTIEYFCQRSFNQGVSESFAELRNCGGHTDISQQFLRIARHILARLTLCWSARPSASIELAGHRGYRFHQKEYRRDPTVREWVLRKNFLNEMACVPTPRPQVTANESHA